MALAGLWTISAGNDENYSKREKIAIKGLPSAFLIVAGYVASGLLNRELVAYHEAGHTLALVYYPEHNVLDRVSINPFLSTGEVLAAPARDNKFVSDAQLFNRIICAVSGEIAEIERYGSQHKPVERTLSFDKAGAEMSARMLLKGRATDNAIKEVISEAKEISRSLLCEKRNELDALAEALLERKRLNRTEIYDVLQKEDPLNTVTDSSP